MHPMINIAIKAAREAGRMILKASDNMVSIDIRTKNVNEYVTDVDLQAEKIITQTIRKAYPSHGILGEEGHVTEGDEYLWIIDPLDGTTNFVHSFPHYAISIAVKLKNRLECAVIYDPVRDDLFTASRGGGAQLNNRRLRVSNAKNLAGTLIGTGFPYRHPAHLDFYLHCFKSIFSETAGIRRAGSAALDLAYVAAGKLDGFWEIGLNEWDYAAGVLLIKEAGGLVGDFTGSEDYKRSGNIVAGNPKVFKTILQSINPYLHEFL